MVGSPRTRPLGPSALYQARGLFQYHGFSARLQVSAQLEGAGRPTVSQANDRWEMQQLTTEAPLIAQWAQRTYGGAPIEIIVRR